MFITFYSLKSALFRRMVSGFVGFAVILSLAIPPSIAQLLPNLPAPGQMIGLTPVFQPAMLRGMSIHPDNPLQFDFIVDRGQNKLGNEELKQESEKLIKFFLAAMTIPDKEAWVNLSPYEKDRIIPDALGQTEMGRQMLEQDYILKQISSSLTNPDKELGQKFWNEVKARAQKQFDVSQIPLSTFNKVWIVPDRATVVEKDGFAYITESKLNVMVDEDYVSYQKNNVGAGSSGPIKGGETPPLQSVGNLSTQVFREMILPKLVEEVNTGKNFSPTRQVYQSVVLAAWYKKTLKDSLLGRIYADKSKVLGVENDDKDIKQKVYEQYIEAFKKGAYNIIKEEGGSDGDLIPRKYFSGGLELGMSASSALTINHDPAQMKIARDSLAKDMSADQIALVRANAVEASTGEGSAVSASSSSSVERDLLLLAQRVDDLLSNALTQLESSLNRPQQVSSLEIKRLYLLAKEELDHKNSLEKELKASTSPYHIFTRNIAVLREISAKLAIIRSLLELSSTQSLEGVNKLQKNINLAHNEGLLFNETYESLNKISTTLFERLARGTWNDFVANAVYPKFMQLFPGKSADARIVFAALVGNFIFQIRSNPSVADLNNMINGAFGSQLRERELKSGKVMRIMIEELRYTESYNQLIAPSDLLTAMKELSDQFNPPKSSSSSVTFNMPLVQNTRINLNTGSGDSSDIYVANWNGRQVAVKVDRKGRSPEADAKVLLDLWPYGGPEYYGMVRIKVGTEERVGIAMEIIEGIDIGSLITEKGRPDFSITMTHIQSIKALRDELVTNGKSLQDVQWGDFILTPGGRVRPIDMAVVNRTNSSDEKQFGDIITWLENNRMQINVKALAAKKGMASSGVMNNDKAATPVGGIDFDPSKLNLQIKRDGHGVPLPLTQQDLMNIDIKGLQPIIIKIQPVNFETLPILGQLDAQPEVVGVSKS